MPFTDMPDAMKRKADMAPGAHYGAVASFFSLHCGAQRERRRGMAAPMRCELTAASARQRAPLRFFDLVHRKRRLAR